MPPVTTTYAVNLFNSDGAIAGNGTLSFTQPDAHGNVTVSFTSKTKDIPSVPDARGTITQCGGISTLQVNPTVGAPLAVQASIYTVKAGNYSASGLGGGIAVAQLSPLQSFAGAMLGRVQLAEGGTATGE